MNINFKVNKFYIENGKTGNSAAVNHYRKVIATTLFQAPHKLVLITILVQF